MSGDPSLAEIVMKNNLKRATMQEHFYSCMVGLWLFRMKTPLKACFLQSLSEVLFCDIPGIKPQIWFSYKDKGMMSMTVRAAMRSDKSKVEVPLSFFQGKGGNYPAYFINIEFNSLEDEDRPYLYRGHPFNYEMSDVLTLPEAVNARVYAELSLDSTFVIKDHMPKDGKNS